MLSCSPSSVASILASASAFILCISVRFRLHPLGVFLRLRSLLVHTHSENSEDSPLLYLYHSVFMGAHPPLSFSGSNISMLSLVQTVVHLCLMSLLHEILALSFSSSCGVQDHACVSSSARYWMHRLNEVIHRLEYPPLQARVRATKHSWN